MCRYSRSGALLATALLAAALAVEPAASAQTTMAPQVATGPAGMPIQEWQGVGCLYGGVTAGFAVLYYSDAITVAITGDINPLLLVPLVTAGVVGGCIAGYNSAPGLVWLYRHL